jgi:hypothetical protein
MGKKPNFDLKMIIATSLTDRKTKEGGIFATVGMY